MRQVRVVLAAVALGALGCGGSGEPGPVRQQDAHVYTAVVRWYAEQERFEGADDPPVAYLDGLDDHSVPLEVQIGVVRTLADELTVRFIDALEEAVDTQAEGAPVRNGGLLVRMGSIVARDDRIEVDAERYEGQDEASRHRFVVEPGDDQWRVADDPAELPPPDEG